jgi:hypothetical protein
MFAFLQEVTLGQSSLLRGSAPSGPTHGTTIENHGIPQLGPVDRDSLRDLAVTTHLAIYYYATYSNILAQNWLPRRADYDEENQVYRFIRHFLDMSANDFQIVARTLDQWRIAEPTFIANHRLNLIYGVEGQRVKAAVRNANQKFEELEGAVPPESGPIDRGLRRLRGCVARCSADKTPVGPGSHQVCVALDPCIGASRRVALPFSIVIIRHCFLRRLGSPGVVLALKHEGAVRRAPRVVTA